VRRLPPLSFFSFLLFFFSSLLFSSHLEIYKGVPNAVPCHLKNKKEKKESGGNRRTPK
jgi:hypothetical protein